MNLLNTFNMVIECLKFYLEAFQKSFKQKMGVLARSHNPILRLDFSKIGFFVLFLEYIFFDVSYDFDFFTGVQSNVRRTFSIP